MRVDFKKIVEHGRSVMFKKLGPEDIRVYFIIQRSQDQLFNLLERLESLLLVSIGEYEEDQQREGEQAESRGAL